MSSQWPLQFYITTGCSRQNLFGYTRLLVNCPKELVVKTEIRFVERCNMIKSYDYINLHYNIVCIFHFAVSVLSVFTQIIITCWTATGLCSLWTWLHQHISISPPKSLNSVIWSCQTVFLPYDNINITHYWVIRLILVFYSYRSEYTF